MGKRNNYEIQDELLEKPAKIMSEKEKNWLDEMVEIEFYNLEEPGLLNKFPFGTTNEFKVYNLMHGGKYTLPRKVIKHIESRQTPIWKFMPDGFGKMAKQRMGYKPRFQCRQVFN